MVPVLFRIGSIDITSFGVMVALGALAGLWVFQRELRWSHLPDAAVDAAIVGLFGGLIGAKLLFVAEHAAETPWLSLLLDRGGMSWFGGFAGGILAGLAFIAIKGWPIVPVIAAATPALAIGQLLGRIGCFLVGDDYGRPTNLPWGVAFPKGLPPTTQRVHPTQIYEAIFLGILAWLLIRWRRRGASDRTVLGAYFLLAGGFRFLLEFIRVNIRVLGPFTVAQLCSGGVVVVGAVLLTVPRRAHAPVA